MFLKRQTRTTRAVDFVFIFPTQNSWKESSFILAFLNFIIFYFILLFVCLFVSYSQIWSWCASSSKKKVRENEKFLFMFYLFYYSLCPLPVLIFLPKASLSKSFMNGYQLAFLSFSCAQGQQSRTRVATSCAGGRNHTAEEFPKKVGSIPQVNSLKFFLTKSAFRVHNFIF